MKTEPAVPDVLQANREAILRQVLEIVGADYDDALFVAGSMAEGLANRNSDVDIYFIGGTHVAGSETSARKHEQTGTITHIGRQEVNLSVLDPVGLAELRESYQAALGSLTCTTGIAQLVTEDDLKVLHRIRTGRPLRNADRLTELRTAFDTDRLPAYLVNMYGIAAINRLTDVAGELADGHRESAAWMAQQALVHIGQYVLAAHGVTNPGTKWLVRLLRRGLADCALGELVIELLAARPLDLLGCLDAVSAGLSSHISAQESLAGPYLKAIATERIGGR